ncbi:MAG: T9SS type A sorting domain-containing protein [Prolixibacteraceae bacterium]|jgi:hypothetical protein|nr:T9SS type A sorting domain-containing protein [Prolixibacteraceae bacterium]
MKKISTLLIFIFAVSTAFSQVEGKWTLAPQANCLAVGPGQGDFSWWNLDGSDGSRDCIVDDTIAFNEDGTFQNIMGDETWVEPWQGAEAEGCGAPVTPFDGSAEAEWSIDGDILTISGVGAHIGLAKVINLGEIADVADAAASIDYIFEIVEGDDGAEIMKIDIEIADGGFWHFEYIKFTGATPTNVIEHSFLDLNVYPNPAGDQITVEGVNVKNVQVMNTSGQVIINSETNKIDVSSLKTGVYFVAAETAKGIATSKFMKK